jgi:hypothetical protein
MFQRLVSLSPDLSRLRADGYDIAIGKSQHLLVRDVPYVNAAKEVKRGIIAMVLDVGGETTVIPKSHVVYFVGECPCDVEGKVLPGVSPNTNEALGGGMTPNHQLSRKPTMSPHTGGYADYYEKVTTYVAIIGGPAQVIDPLATTKTHPVVLPEDPTSVFHYLDTAESKAGILNANSRLANHKVAIVGVGGTGSYVLDLIAKTPVAEIHIFDHDLFLNHNAFRCPGAPGLEDLKARHSKVKYLESIYSRMHKGIKAHSARITVENIEALKGKDCVFLCIDDGGSKGVIIGKLEEWGAPFIDVGMGIQLGDEDALGGIVTVTTSVPGGRDEFRKRVSLTSAAAQDEYSRNVQIAELNALNAAFAVVKWKKLVGYYQDVTRERWCAYTIRTNHLLSEDCLEG